MAILPDLQLPSKIRQTSEPQNQIRQIVVADMTGHPVTCIFVKTKNVFPRANYILEKAL